MPVVRSILVPLDGSAFAEQALAFAIALGRKGRTRLRLALVHQVPPAPKFPEARKVFRTIEAATRGAERAYLERLAERSREEGQPEVTCVVLSGRPGPALVEQCAVWEPSLVVMSTHGRGPLERAWLGSVADHLVRHLTVPLLLLRPKDEALQPVAAFGRILVALDGSPAAETALEHAVEIAHEFGSELYLVRVIRPVPPVTEVPMVLTDGFDAELPGLFRKEAQAYLDAQVTRLHEAGISARGIAVLGDGVAGTIIDLARTEAVGLVALGTRGHGRAKRFILGSVADKIIRGAHCPVLVCPKGTPRS